MPKWNKQLITLPNTVHYTIMRDVRTRWRSQQQLTKIQSKENGKVINSEDNQTNLAARQGCE